MTDTNKNRANHNERKQQDPTFVCVLDQLAFTAMATATFADSLFAVSVDAIDIPAKPLIIFLTKIFSNFIVIVPENHLCVERRHETENTTYIWMCKNREHLFSQNYIATKFKIRSQTASVCTMISREVVQHRTITMKLTTSPK